MTEHDKADKLIEIDLNLKRVMIALLGKDEDGGLIKDFNEHKMIVNALKTEHENCMSRQRERKVDYKWIFVTAILLIELLSRFLSVTPGAAH